MLDILHFRGVLVELLRVLVFVRRLQVRTGVLVSLYLHSVVWLSWIAVFFFPFGVRFFMEVRFFLLWFRVLAGFLVFVRHELRWFAGRFILVRGEFVLFSRRVFFCVFWRGRHFLFFRRGFYGLAVCWGRPLAFFVSFTCLVGRSILYALVVVRGPVCVGLGGLVVPMTYVLLTKGTDVTRMVVP